MASIQYQPRHNRRYRVMWREGGRLVSRGFTTYEEAEAWKNERFGQDVTLRGMADAWLASKRATRSGATYARYRGSAEALLASGLVSPAAPPSAVKPSAIEAWRDRRLATVTRRTAYNSLHDLTMMFRWGVKRGYLPESPMAKVDMPTWKRGVVRWMESDEAERLLQAFEGDPELHLVALLAMKAGLRLGEIIGLTLGDVAGDVITVRTTKSAEPRVVAMHTRIRAAIDAWVASGRSRAGESAFLIPAGRKGCRTGGAFGKMGLSARFSRACKAAGFEGITLHKLRHSFACHCLQHQMDLATLRDTLGHSSIQTTEQYVHAVKGNGRDVIAML